jgi:hypothetical protein
MAEEDRTGAVLDAREDAVSTAAHEPSPDSNAAFGALKFSALLV